MRVSEARGKTTNSRARRGEGDKTREAILAAASRLLEELQSEEAVSIRAVADRVGVTAPTIYRYFADKQQLIFEVCSTHFDQFEDEVINPALEANDDPVDALLDIARAYVHFGVNNPEHYRVMFMSHLDHTPEQWADVAMFEQGSFATIIGLVRQGVDRGQIRDHLGTDSPDPAIDTALALWSAVHGLTALVVARPGMPAPELDRRIDALCEVIFQGVVPR